MKITIYELLGMVKDGKAPNKIKVTGTIYDFDEEYGFYFTKTKNGRVALGGKLNEINLIYNFNNENNVEILEEEKKIPEKLEEFGLIQYNLDYIDYKNIETLKEYLNKDFQTIYDTLDLLIKNQNKIIDYLKSKGDE